MSGIGPLGGAGGGSLHQIMAMRQQILDRSQLLQEVHTASTAPAPSAAVEQAPTGGFGGALKHALDGVSASQNRAEALSAGFERGEVTDMAQVMLARQEAGIAFEATLQVRNRLLSAYQDIMRMGV
jgi:flagellar hook-basal body complex protein FliE